MKRKGGFYEEVYAFDNLLKAYLKTRKNKRYREDILKLSFFLEETLFEIQDDLRSETYKHGGYKKFIVRDSKKREIKAPYARDRIVHHALYSLLYPLFDKTFTYRSYACRKGKGNHRALNDIRRKLKGKGECFCLKADISKYFYSVDRCFLMKMIERKVKDKKVLSLIKEILKSNKQGIPIGNLTSQLFANIYLNEMDQFIKRKLKVSFYFRYMDDFLMIAKTKIELRETRQKLEVFLQDELKLYFNEKATRFFPIRIGIPFLGFLLFEDYSFPRKRMVKKMLKKVEKKAEKEVLLIWNNLMRKTKSYGLFKKEVLRR